MNISAQFIPGQMDIGYHFTCEDPPEKLFRVHSNYLPMDNLDYVGDDGVNLTNIINIDPTSGEIEIEADVTNYRGFGRVIFTGHSSATGQELEFSLYFIDCCEGVPQIDRILAEPLPMSFWEHTGVISGEQLMVLGNVDVDISVLLESSQFDMGTDAAFDLDGDVIFNSDQSTFLPFCEYRWDGIITTSSSNHVIMENNTFWTGALRGVYGYDNAKVQIIDSRADNNNISVLLEEYTSGGSFPDNSYFELTGSTIEYVTDISTWTHHPNSPINITALTTINGGAMTTGIRVMSSSHVVVGHSSLDPNLFNLEISGDYVSLSISDSRLITENNDFISEFGAFAVNANSSALRIGGVSLSQGNYIENFSMLFVESSATIQNCYFDAGWAGPGQSIVFENSETRTPPPGTDEGNHILNSFIYNYRVRFSNPIIAADIAVHVKENITEATEFLFEHMEANTEGRVVVNDNTMLNAYRDYLVKLEESHGATIGDNTFRNSIHDYDISPSTGTQAVGVFIIDSEDVELHQNTFTPLAAGATTRSGFKSAMYVADDSDGLMMFCNSFHNVYNAVQFSNADINTDFGSPGEGANNTFEILLPFQGFWNGSTFISTSNGSFTGSFLSIANNIDYHFQGSPNTIYDPMDYGDNGIDVSPGNIIEVDGAGSSCPPVPSQLLSFEDKVFVSNSNINIFPNPSSDQINIEIGDDFLYTEGYITDLSGRVVWQHTFEVNKMSLILSTGQYVLTLQNSMGEKFNKKLICLVSQRC